MKTILSYVDIPCPTCGGNGHSIDQGATNENAKDHLGIVPKSRVADKMGISPQYLGDVLAGRRHWNIELAEKFHAAVNECRAS